MHAYTDRSAVLRILRGGPAPEPSANSHKSGSMTPSVPYVMMPLAVPRDAKLSPGARVLYGLMAAYWWGSGECRASHATLAADMGIQPRQLRRYASELVDKGHVTERPHGHGQAKAYSPNQSYLTAYEDPNGTNTTAYEGPNRSDMTAYGPQQVISDLTNRSDMTTEVDRGRTGVSIDTPDIATSETPVLQTAPNTPEAKPTRKSTAPKRTRAPESFTVTEALATWADGLGLNRARLDSETERFLDYHRGKGSLQADWTATWRTWMRRAVEYGPRNGAAVPTRNGRGDGPAKPSRPHTSEDVRRSVANWGRKER